MPRGEFGGILESGHPSIINCGTSFQPLPCACECGAPNSLVAPRVRRPSHMPQTNRSQNPTAGISCSRCSSVERSLPIWVPATRGKRIDPPPHLLFLGRTTIASSTAIDSATRAAGGMRPARVVSTSPAPAAPSTRERFGCTSTTTLGGARQGCSIAWNGSRCSRRSRTRSTLR